MFISNVTHIELLRGGEVVQFNLEVLESFPNITHFAYDVEYPGEDTSVQHVNLRKLVTLASLQVIVITGRTNPLQPMVNDPRVVTMGWEERYTELHLEKNIYGQPDPLWPRAAEKMKLQRLKEETGVY